MKKELIKIAAVSLLMASTSANSAWEAISIKAIANSVSWATDINDSGIMVGEIKRNTFTEHFDSSGKSTGFSYSDRSSHPFITGENGIGTKILDIEGRAESINNAGQVIGKSSAGAVFMTGPNGAGFTDLGAPDGSSSYAYDINNSGQVVGYYATKANPGTSPYGFEDPRPFITDPNGANIRILGTSGGAAFGINDHGQAVISTNILCDFCTPGDGFSLLADNDTITQINDFSPNGLYYFNAKAINNNGQIAGTGISTALPFSFSAWRAFMVSSDTSSPTPVPEPSTYAMLLAGLGLLFFRTKTELNS